MNLPADSSSVVTVVNDTLTKKLDTTLDVGAKALQSAEVQEMIRAYGLEDHIKNVKQEHVKNLLAVVGSYFILAKFKKNWPIVVGGFAALYLYAKSSGEGKVQSGNTVAEKKVIQPENDSSISGHYSMY